MKQEPRKLPRMREIDTLEGEAGRAGSGILPLLERGPLYALAHGELNESDAAELQHLKGQIQSRIGFRCDGYKEKCLRRRIAVRMRARGVHGFSKYAALLERDPQEYARLLDAVTINVSKFFRNAEVWTRLRAEVIPLLFEIDAPEIRIWSAGCAAGEEAYSMAMLLLEHAEATRANLGRFRIIGTDIDTVTLDAARRAEYSEFAFSETPPETRARWFQGPKRTKLCQEVRRLVDFAPLDLISDAYPAPQHMILCRNVVIYFERGIQEMVFRGFHAAVAPGGFLLLGKVEALFGGATALFRAISNRERLFRKP